MDNIAMKNTEKFILIMVYKFTLDILYVLFISEKFEYMGYYNDFLISKYLLGLFLLVIAFTTTPKDKKRPSSILLQLHFILMYIPMLTLYAFVDVSLEFTCYSVGVFSLQCILVRLLPSIRIIKLKNSKMILYTLISMITFFVYFSMLKANGIPSLSALNLLNVYEIRGETVYPFLMTYLVNWQAKVINPFLITLGFLKHRWTVFFGAIFLQILMYLITAHKTFLFIPVAIILVILILDKIDFMIVGLRIAIMGLITAYTYYQIFDRILVPSIIIRRFLFAPAHIKYSYYDFFSSHSFIYFSNGLIGKILKINYPYDTKIPYLIGEKYYNSPEMWTNTGFIADAYANLGISGMVIISIIFVLILKLIDSFGKKMGIQASVGLTLFLILGLNDVGLLTTLLSGGLLFLLIVLYLYSTTDDKPRVT